MPTLQYAVFIRFQAEDFNLIISAAALPDARTFLPYSQAPAITGAVPPLAFSGNATTLPPGFAVDALSGAVAGLTSVPGDYLVGYVVTDAFRARSAQIPLHVIDSPLLLMTDNTPLLGADNNPVLLTY